MGADNTLPPNPSNPPDPKGPVVNCDVPNTPIAPEGEDDGGLEGEGQ